jgi:hypothetical protein
MKSGIRIQNTAIIVILSEGASTAPTLAITVGFADLLGCPLR